MSRLVPSRLALGRWRQLLLDATSAWLDQRASSKGAALAFHTLFSMAPMLLVVIALAGAEFTPQYAITFGRLTNVRPPPSAVLESVPKPSA